MSEEATVNSGADFTAIERLPLAERAGAYKRRLEQLSRALDDADEPLDFDGLSIDETSSYSTESNDAGRDNTESDHTESANTDLPEGADEDA